MSNESKWLSAHECGLKFGLEDKLLVALALRGEIRHKQERRKSRYRNFYEEASVREYWTKLKAARFPEEMPFVAELPKPAVNTEAIRAEVTAAITALRNILSLIP